MKWFWLWFGRWAARRQRIELNEFINILRSMDAEEIGPLIALATHWRHSFLTYGYNVIDPFFCVSAYPDVILFLSKSVGKFQKQGKLENAAAFMVWLHTIRACATPSLRGPAREMWGQLSRGFPHVKKAAQGAFLLWGVELNIEHADKFPVGFTPVPLGSIYTTPPGP